MRVSVIRHLPSSLLPTTVLDADIRHHTDVATSPLKIRHRRVDSHNLDAVGNPDLGDHLLVPSSLQRTGNSALCLNGRSPIRCQLDMTKCSRIDIVVRGFIRGYTDSRTYGIFGDEAVPTRAEVDSLGAYVCAGG
jgi:hypothetical protein